MLYDKLNRVKMSVPPQLIHRLTAMPVRVTMRLFLGGKRKVSSYSEVYGKK